MTEQDTSDEDEFIRRAGNYVNSVEDSGGHDPGWVYFYKIAVEPWLQSIKEAVWEEAAEQISDWMWNNPSPSGIPHDPPRNPYSED